MAKQPKQDDRWSGRELRGKSDCLSMCGAKRTEGWRWEQRLRPRTIGSDWQGKAKKRERSCCGCKVNSRGD